MLLQRGATTESKVSLLRPWDGSWEWQSCCQLLLLPWKEQMSLCGGAVQPSHTALGGDLLEEVAQDIFGWRDG